MKKTYVKDTTRNIGKQIVSYLSIVVISMLAVMAYLGINFASESIAQNGNRFYDVTGYRDLEIISTMLVTQEDLDVLRSVEGVRDVEGVYYTTGKVNVNGILTDVDIVSLSERINVPQVVEGRLPADVSECAIEQSVSDDTGLKIGDTVHLQDHDGLSPDYLTVGDYVITGIVLHPDHATWPLQVPGNRDVVVMKEAFDQGKLEGNYMKAELLVSGTEGMSRFGKDYRETVDEVMARVKSIAEEREIARYNQLHDKYQGEIDEGQAELDDAQTKLDDARNELDTNRNKIETGESELADAARQIEDSERQLADAETQLQDGRRELDENRARLNDARRELNDAKKQLDAGEARLADAERQLESARKQLREAEAELTNGYNELVDSYDKIEDAKSTVRDALYNALYLVIGDYVDRFDWATASYSPDVEDKNATATQFKITKGITIDLKRSMSDNIFAQLSKLALTEDEWRDAYEAATGKILDIIEGHTVLETIVAIVTDTYDGIDSRYEEFAGYARDWDKGHDKYISGLEEYRSGLAEYNSGLAEYNDGRATLDKKWKEYRAGLAQYNAGVARLNEGQDKYDTGLQDYENGMAELEDGRRRYEEGSEELERGREALAQGETDYQNGLDRYNEGVKTLDDAKEKLATMDDCRWVVLNTAGNPSFFIISGNVDDVGDMGVTFALVFVIVGAMVIYATVGRIVDEQRSLVGTTKALGFFNWEISGKYIAFGVTATALGMILGVIAGYYGIQNILMAVYGKYYVYQSDMRAFIWLMTSLVFLGGIIISTLTVLSACLNLVKSAAIELMHDKMPVTKRKGKKSKTKGSLYGRMIIFNIINDKKRVAVTIASIAGCCTLLVAGMTMKYSITKALDSQFSDIECYDMKVLFDRKVSETAEEDIKKILDEAGTRYVAYMDVEQAYNINDEMDSTELICGDLDVMSDFFCRLVPDSKTQINGQGDGVWVRQKTAEVYNLKEGDEITLYNSAMKPYKVRVAGFFENYGGRFMVMSSDSYTKYMEKEPVNSGFLVLTGDADVEALKAKISATEGFKEIKLTSDLVATYKTFTDVLDLIALLFIAIAGLMAYFILLNIVVMYINQKKRELTIMRINGFTVREVKKYISLELIVSTVVGILAGCGLGSLLGYRVLLLIEGTGLRFIRSIQLEAWGLSALITVIYAVIIAAIAMRKIKYLKLTDAV
ncbi:FtsX-like permease family protein [Ruminococcaceae bacterium YRB3002]|nr:FtsX-like permease family protein [Ruminococcaceae bacterium YRB3002]